MPRWWRCDAAGVLAAGYLHRICAAGNHSHKHHRFGHPCRVSCAQPCAQRFAPAAITLPCPSSPDCALSCRHPACDCASRCTSKAMM